VLFADASSAAGFWSARRSDLLFYSDTSCVAAGFWLRNGDCVPW
jgi:hypothetical protein